VAPSFKSPQGALTTIHNFDYTDAAVRLRADASHQRRFLWDELGGWTDGYGTAFSLSMGLAPFAQPRPSMGVVGTAVTILGNNLTGTTQVSFNGTAATHKVVSATEIATKVPSGATTGALTVTTPSGTLSSGHFL